MDELRPSKQGSVIDGLENLLRRESDAQVRILPDGTVEPWNDPAGWVDHLIGDGKRDNIIVPMSVALELQALLRAGHEPPTSRGPDDPTYDQLAAENQDLWGRSIAMFSVLPDDAKCGDLQKIRDEYLRWRRSEPPGALERIRDARLTWGMACPCVCEACIEFDRVLLPALSLTKSADLYTAVENAVRKADADLADVIRAAGETSAALETGDGS